jgi:hypothetical protein
MKNPILQLSSFGVKLGSIGCAKIKGRKIMARAIRGVVTVPLLGDIGRVISACWSRRTSYDPVGWSSRNRAWGQCAVTALIVQDLFGGVLLRGFVNGIEHYWNRLPNEEEVDLTRTQFPNVREVASVALASREFVLASPSTASRYAELKRRVNKGVHNVKRQKLKKRI